MRKREKVYSVEFMGYTNFSKTTVYTSPENLGNGIYSFIDSEYLDVAGGFLVRESELDRYKVYGDGYRHIEFVGYMEFDDEKTDGKK